MVQSASYGVSESYDDYENRVSCWAGNVCSNVCPIPSRTPAARFYPWAAICSAAILLCYCTVWSATNGIESTCWSLIPDQAIHEPNRSGQKPKGRMLLHIVIGVVAYPASVTSIAATFPPQSEPPTTRNHGYPVIPSLNTLQIVRLNTDVGCGQQHTLDPIQIL